MEDEENKNQEEEDQENVDNAEDVTFISRFFLQPEELYKKEKYLISIMRISIFERIINTYLFQSTSKELSLYPYLENLKKDQKQLKFFNNILKFISEKFIDDFPLTFYSEVIKEINRIMKIDDLKNLKFDKYILKFEFLLAWHFENDKTN